ncbi:unnamed protein product, partial [Phaeothamnion confervicola]
SARTGAERQREREGKRRGSEDRGTECRNWCGREWSRRARAAEKPISLGQFLAERLKGRRPLCVLIVSCHPFLRLPVWCRRCPCQSCCSQCHCQYDHRRLIRSDTEFAQKSLAGSKLLSPV